MDDGKKFVLIISGVVLAASNIMILIYGIKVVLFNAAADPQITDVFGLGWYFWFFVLLTITFDACYVLGIVELKRIKK